LVNNISLESAYREALRLTNSHYENFPVVSLFIPRRLRKHIAVVYQFARQADDIADEGKSNCELRIENLELYRYNFSRSLNGKYQNDFWLALHNTILEYKLTPKYFYDLLDAFKQDIYKNRYNSFDEVLNYCERSANPVGRIVLELFDIRDEESSKYSDAICTALQLTNFYQDVSIDIKKDRIYIPIDEIERFGVKLNQFELKQNNTNFEQLLKFQVDRTKDYFSIGRNLFARLPRKLEKQIKATVLGGEKILEKIGIINYNVLNHRPKLSKIDYMNILLKTLLK